MTWNLSQYSLCTGPKFEFGAFGIWSNSAIHSADRKCLPREPGNL